MTLLIPFDLQSALFGSWFSCKFAPILHLLRVFQCLISFTVGLPAVFWLYMNQGQYFRNWKKTILTITNVLIFIISCAIVSGILVMTTFLPTCLIYITRHATNTFAVWIRPLGVGCRNSRRFGFQQLVLC